MSNTGHFEVKSIIDLDNVALGQRIEESDYATLTPGGKFVQLEYKEVEDSKDPYTIKPGIWHITKTMEGLKLDKTSFVKDEIIDDLVSTHEIEEAVDCFLNNIHLYKEFGIEVAKRSILLYGPQGAGKSVTIAKICEKYVKDEKTAVVIWHTAKWEAHQVKDFIQRFAYENVEKLILVAEDLGGYEKEDHRAASDSSLLSLLDNNEKTFTIPVCILATTNFPATFMANITNRPGRFDDKVRVSYPTGDARRKLLSFFSKDNANKEALELMASSSCTEFSPAHIREAYVRSRLRSKPLVDVIKIIIKEIGQYNKGFENKGAMGFMSDED